MLAYCFYLLLLGGVVTPLSISRQQPGLHSIGGGKMISWEPRTMISSEDYPCEKEGLYSHPTNCSRFYRCVDFTRESRIFSRYLFECPEGMVFAATIQACVPGVCPEHADKIPDSSSGATDVAAGESTPVVEMPSPGAAGDSAGASESGSIPDPTAGEAGMGMGMESTTTEAAVVEVGMTTVEAPVQGEAGGAAGSGDSTGTAEKEITGLPPVIDQDTSVVQPENIPGSAEPCKTKYVQHEKFCNLFHLCEDSSSLFSCYEGTAFSTERQMCRLLQFDTALCEGKEIFVPSAEFFRSAFNWDEVGVVPLDGNPVYNSNPYFFMNIGDALLEEEEGGGFQPTPSEEPLKPVEFSNPFQTSFPSISSRPRPQPVTENKERKKMRFSSLLGSITDLITGKTKLTPSRSTSPITNKKTVVPKVTRKDKVTQAEKPKFKDTSSFNYAPYLNSYSDLATVSEMFNTADPSKTSISTSPFVRQGINYPFTADSIPSVAYSPFKGLRQTQSPYLNQGVQLGYIASPSTVMYSPYAGMIPQTFGTPDISSIFRTQPSSPSNVFSQAQTSLPFSSSGNFFPYSPSFSSSLGLVASPYGFLYDPTRNSLIPVAIPPSYLNSIYASLLGSNPYSTLMQLNDKEAEELLASSFVSGMSESKPTDKFEPKRKETSTKKVSRTKTPTPQKYPFVFNTEDSSSLSSLLPAFEARNENGETYQIVPLSQDEVDTLAQRGLLERAMKINKPFTYDDLENLKEGEVILTSFPRKK